MKEAIGGDEATQPIASFSENIDKVVLKISGFFFMDAIAGDVYARKRPMQRNEKAATNVAWSSIQENDNFGDILIMNETLQLEKNYSFVCF